MKTTNYKKNGELLLALQEGGNAVAKVEQQKRKTTTSTAVKARYNKKHYTRIPLDIPKDLAQEFKDKCKASGRTCSSILKEAIENFINNQS